MLIQLYKILCFVILNNDVNVIFFCSHGTECAGTAAAEANNELCGVGVAYQSWIAG